MCRYLITLIILITLITLIILISLITLITLITQFACMLIYGGIVIYSFRNFGACCVRAHDLRCSGVVYVQTLARTPHYPLGTSKIIAAVVGKLDKKGVVVPGSVNLKFAFIMTGKLIGLNLAVACLQVWPRS